MALPNGHEFEYALGVGDGQGSLVYCSAQRLKESDTTERLNGMCITESLCSTAEIVSQLYFIKKPTCIVIYIFFSKNTLFVSRVFEYTTYPTM